MEQFNDKLGTVRNHYGGSACPTSNPLDVLNARPDPHSTSPDHPQLGSFVVCVRLQIDSYQLLVKVYLVIFDDGSSQCIPTANLQEVCICRVATSSGRI